MDGGSEPFIGPLQDFSLIRGPERAIIRPG